MKKRLLAIAILLVVSLTAGSASTHAAGVTKPVNARKFAGSADAALTAMKARAAELKITGVAVVCNAQGDSVQEWISKMAVVGRMKDVPSGAQKGSNLVAVAYSKAAEMADTLQNSGTTKRTPLTGEFGYQGGLIFRIKSGYVMAVFSGGKSEDDLEVARTGLEVLKGAL